MTAVAYDVAKKVYEGALGRGEGKDEIVGMTGMNAGSAGDYISNFLSMMNGEKYTRTLNEYTTRYFLSISLKIMAHQHYRRPLQLVKCMLIIMQHWAMGVWCMLKGLSRNILLFEGLDISDPKLKRSLAECGNFSVELEVADMLYNNPDLSVD